MINAKEIKEKALKDSQNNIDSALSIIETALSKAADLGKMYTVVRDEEFKKFDAKELNDIKCELIKYGFKVEIVPGAPSFQINWE
nr:MAG TPA: SUMT-III C-methyltransferase (S-Adenosyl-L-methionine:uroporphyrinogen III methyltransferase, SUMT) [Caudoviricetes sp.]